MGENQFFKGAVVQDDLYCDGPFNMHGEFSYTGCYMNITLRFVGKAKLAELLISPKHTNKCQKYIKIFETLSKSIRWEFLPCDDDNKVHDVPHVAEVAPTVQNKA
jgi:hypothetical protein